MVRYHDKVSDFKDSSVGRRDRHPSFQQTPWFSMWLTNKYLRLLRTCLVEQLRRCWIHGIRGLIVWSGLHE